MTSKKFGSVTVAAALAAGVLSAPSASAATRVWVKTTIPGESAICSSCFDVLAWSWGMSATQGNRSSCTNVADLSLQKYVDEASAGLMIALTMGQDLGILDLNVQRVSETGNKSISNYLNIVLHQPKVSSLSTSGAAGDAIVESVSFSFGSADVTYYPADGGPPVMAKIIPGTCL